MNIPSYMHTPMVDKDGMPTATWQLFFTQLLSQMQDNLSDQGYVLPNQAAATVAQLSKSGDGTMLYVTAPNSVDDSVQIMVNGTFRKVQLV